MSTLKVGDIVRVVGEDLVFRDKQGQVVAISTDSDGVTIHVWHGRECDLLLDFVTRQGLSDLTATEPPTTESYSDDPRTQRYDANDLVLVDRWDIQVVAERQFPDCHHITEYTLATKCQITGCSRPVQPIRTLFNLWGNVIILSTCSECHAKNHGIRGDGLVRG